MIARASDDHDPLSRRCEPTVATTDYDFTELQRGACYGREFRVKNSGHFSETIFLYAVEKPSDSMILQELGASARRLLDRAETSRPSSRPAVDDVLLDLPPALLHQLADGCDHSLDILRLLLPHDFEAQRQRAVPCVRIEYALGRGPTHWSKTISGAWKDNSLQSVYALREMPSRLPYNLTWKALRAHDGGLASAEYGLLDLSWESVPGRWSTHLTDEGWEVVNRITPYVQYLLTDPSVRQVLPDDSTGYLARQVAQAGSRIRDHFYVR